MASFAKQTEHSELNYRVPLVGTHLPTKLNMLRTEPKVYVASSANPFPHNFGTARSPHGGKPV
jgi:hypothetical protein